MTYDFLQQIADRLKVLSQNKGKGSWFLSLLCLEFAFAQSLVFINVFSVFAVVRSAHNIIDDKNKN